MVDTEGSEVHTNELKEPIKAEVKHRPESHKRVHRYALQICSERRTPREQRRCKSHSHA